MPSFKPKTNKKIMVDENSTVTLDGKHSEKISEFSSDDERIKLLSKELKSLTEKQKKSGNLGKTGQKLEHFLERNDKI